jgi:YD repeat-containing protein
MTSLKKILASLILSVALFYGLNAQVENRNNRVYANYLHIQGCFIQSNDDKYVNSGSWASGFTNAENKVVIELGLDEDMHLAHFQATKICAKFDLELTDLNHNVYTLTNQQLDINYNPADLTRYKDKAQLIIPDYYAVKVYNMVVTEGATNLACSAIVEPCRYKDIYIQAEVITKRIYPFSFASTFSATSLSDSLTTNDHLKISWDYLAGATEYELEYTHVDDYSWALAAAMHPSVLTYDFEHDATRIVTNNNHYYIPLTYERGYILYRLRPIGINPSLQRIEGAWYPTAASGTISLATCTVAIAPAFPADKLSWQSTKTFAEEGKTGIGVSYADAMGLPRQSLARLNTEFKTMAQATLYDFYMRPAVNIMPSPVSGLDFKYRFGLNIYAPVSATPKVFDKKIFENALTNNACSPQGFTINPQLSLGAANYYSSFNPYKEKYQGYLPIADGLPYTQVKYTNDGLNRIARQTMPGKTHQLGSDKDVRYFYVKPMQVELDRLFGAEAGRAAFYTKQISIDPNGQKSATYLDSYGRTVATSLFGVKPINVDALPNYTPTILLTEHFENPPTNHPDDDNLCTEVSVKFFASAGSENFYYATSLAAFASPCALNTCFNCVYDVTLSISDECGNEVFDYNAAGSAGFRGSIGPAAPYGTVTCAVPGTTMIAGTSLNVPVAVSFTKTGTYTLYKKICVSKKPVEDYADAFIAVDCDPELEKCTIFNKLLNATDFKGCGPPISCADCKTSVSNYTTTATNSNGSTQTFPNTGPLNGGTNVMLDDFGNPVLGSATAPNGSSPSVYTPTLNAQQISKALENCELLCAGTDRCSLYERAMLADFYPGTGQYAATSYTDTNWANSIFNPLNTLSAPIWSDAGYVYYNAAGSQDYVYLNSVNKNPNSLTIAEYQANFRKSWASTFLNSHPESCKHHFYCNILKESMEYDDKMKNIIHFSDACAQGFVWPTGSTSFSSYKPNTTACNVVPTATDPVFYCAASYIVGTMHAEVNAFKTELTSNFNGTGKDIYEYTAIQSNSSICVAPTSDYMGQNACSEDEQWLIFQQLYLAKKTLLYQKMLTAFLANPVAFGGFYACLTVPAGAKSHFPDLNTTLNTQFPTTGSNPTTFAAYTTMASNAPTSAAYLAAAAQFTTNLTPSSSYTAAQCASACESYTNSWSLNLNLTCPTYSALTTSVKNNILAAMVEVCKMGCDYKTYMLGASTTPDGTSYTLPGTSFTVNNFQQIINYYSGSTACSSIVVNQPTAYPGTVTPLPAYGLTSCKCDQILLAAAMSVTSTSKKAWQHFKDIAGFDLPEYNRLACICKAATNNTWTPNHNWTTVQTATLNGYTLPVDPRLECNSCLKCSDVVTAIDALTLPITSTYTTIYDKIKKVLGNKIFVLNTLNGKFGTHPLEEYLNLYADCKALASAAATYTFENTITEQAKDVYAYLGSLFNDKMLQKGRVMTLCTDTKYFLSSLYTGTLPNIGIKYYSYTTNSNTLTINFNGNTIVLAKPTGYTGTWSSLSTLHNFAAWCPVPVSGANYGFVVTAMSTNNATVLITGSITSSSYAITNLSQGANPVPVLCPIKSPTVNTCAINLISNALTQANHILLKKITARRAAFKQNYLNHCYNALKATNAETLTRSYNGANEYNYTLYYYDEAGNLQRTVPPNGVDVGLLGTLTAPLALNSSQLPAYSSPNGVAQNYVTAYKYDSDNKLTEENTIDGGSTQYIYDEYGRLILSQNAKQYAAGDVYSYILYDENSRVYETGEVPLPATVFANHNITTFNLPLFTSTARTQVTRVYYDQPSTNAAIVSAFNGGQKNLRNRVAWVAYMDNYSATTGVYDQATFYSYDEHGNVNQLVQHLKQLDAFGTGLGLKTIKYEYELISGNMVKATYQKGKRDQFMHSYYYDDDNRLHEVFTSKDNLNWDRDAKYFYYEHGPLARVERADKKVQGTDYFYTLNGWIKGINSDGLNPNNDAGKDATTGTNYLSTYNNIHNWFANDAMAYSLNYYNTGTQKDYEPIKSYTSTDLNPLLSQAGFNATSFALNAITAADGPSLFNGNINSMNTAFINKIQGLASAPYNKPFPQQSAYRYDQLHRLTQMKTFRSYNQTSMAWNAVTGNYDDAYKMNLSYDFNGNIVTLKRNGPGALTASSLNMDDLSYSYKKVGTLNYNLNSNQLMCLNDQVALSNYSEDVDDYATCSSSATRYSYDLIGNLIQDKAEYINTIEWTVDRKVRKITRHISDMLAAGVNKPDIEYQYNTQRQRVVKIVKPHITGTGALSTSEKWQYTYYVYDASGNVMATYNRAASLVAGQTAYYKDELSLNEHHIYGSQRLALAKPSNTLATIFRYFGTYSGGSSGGGGGEDGEGSQTTYTTERNMGYKDFELTNHLGNVITTTSDRKIQASFGPPNDCLSLYDFNSGLPSSSNVAPYQMALSVSSGSLNCAMQTGSGASGINIKFVNNLATTTLYRIEFDFNPGTLSSSDGFNVRPYENNGVGTSVGTYFWPVGTVPAAGHYSFAYSPNIGGAAWTSYLGFGTNGSSTHTFKLDNVALCPYGSLNTVTSYSPDLTSHTDYYPFGQEMPGRKWVGGNEYRYSHNSHEREDEIFENAQSAEHWMFDSRIGRRWEIDPMTYEWQSPYAVFNNNPIYYADPLGLKGEPKTGDTRTNPDGTTSTYNGKGWETTPVGKSTSPDNAVGLDEVDIITTKPEPKPKADAPAPDNGAAPPDNTAVAPKPFEFKNNGNKDHNYVDPITRAAKFFEGLDPAMRSTPFGQWIQNIEKKVHTEVDTNPFFSDKKHKDDPKGDGRFNQAEAPDRPSFLKPLARDKQRNYDDPLEKMWRPDIDRPQYKPAVGKEDDSTIFVYYGKNGKPVVYKVKKGEEAESVKNPEKRGSKIPEGK